MDANGAGAKLYRIRGVAESKQTVEELVDRVNEDLSSSEYDSYGLDESETDEDSGKNQGVANTESVGTEDSDSGKTDSASAVPKKSRKEAAASGSRSRIRMPRQRRRRETWSRLM